MKAAVFALGLLALAPGCAARKASSPQAVRDAYLDALRNDDAAAAYALLAPDVRARVDQKSFTARWRADAAERKHVVAQAAAIDRDAVVAARTATTVHPEGVTLHWAELDGRWLVTGGLPGLGLASTPAAAIRGFLAALGRAELAAAQRFLAPALAEAIRADWAARAEAIEAALAKPGAIELSDDLQRAQLRYEPQRVITLEQTAAGWAITALE